MSNDAKQAFIAALDSDFSEELLAALTVKLPDVSSVAIPTTVEDAIIATGVVNANFNNQVLASLSGLPLYELLLKAGQLNKVHQCMLLSNLTYDGAAGISAILSPVAGGVYFGYFDDWQVQIVRANPKSVTVACNDDTEKLSKSGDVWTVRFPIPVGKHTATMTAEFQGGNAQTENVNFEVRHWEDMPVTSSNDMLQINPQNSFEQVESIELETDNGHVTMTKNLEDRLFEIAEEMAGNSSTIKAMLKAAGKIFNINFTRR